MKETGGQIGGAKADHLLIWIDIRARSRSIGARQHAGVGKGNHGHGETADQNRDERVGVDPGKRESRQSARKGPEDGKTAPFRKVEDVDQQSRSGDRDQNRRKALVVFSAKITARTPAPIAKATQFTLPSATAWAMPRASATVRRPRRRSRRISAIG